MGQYEDTTLQRAAIDADKERTAFRAIATGCSIAAIAVSALLAYGGTLSHETTLKQQAAEAAMQEACTKAGSNWMPIQHMAKGDRSSATADMTMGCVSQADFNAVQASNANIVRTFASQ